MKILTIGTQTKHTNCTNLYRWNEKIAGAKRILTKYPSTNRTAIMSVNVLKLKKKEANILAVYC